MTSRWHFYSCIISIFTDIIDMHVSIKLFLKKWGPKDIHVCWGMWHWCHTMGVFTWRRASPLGRASPLCRDPASQLNSLWKFVFIYMRGGPALLGEISLLTTEISPRRAGNFQTVNALGSAGPPRRASKSKLRTQDKGCLDQHFLNNFSFHKLCLFMCRL